MSSTPYVPASDNAKIIWLNNFSGKISGYAALFSISSEEVTSVQNDAAAFSYWVGQVEVFTTEKEERVSYKNLLRDGPIGSAGGTPPTVGGGSPPLPVPAAMAAVSPPPGGIPVTVPPGIFPRIAKLVQRIKASLNYTQAIGNDLGIIGSEQIIDPATLKPTLKLIFEGGVVEVQWKKGASDSVRIESDKDGTGFRFLAVDTVPHYTDTTPITAPATWKYRAMYIINDLLVGQWSDVASIAVA